jgi:hypothetical protein
MKVLKDLCVVEGRVRLFYFHFEIEERSDDLLRVLGARYQQKFDASFVKGSGERRVLGAHLRVEAVFDGSRDPGIPGSHGPPSAAMRTLRSFRFDEVSLDEVERIVI